MDATKPAAPTRPLPACCAANGVTSQPLAQSIFRWMWMFNVTLKHAQRVEEVGRTLASGPPLVSLLPRLHCISCLWGLYYAGRWHA